MAQRTSADERLTREELGAYLSELGAEFEGDREEIDVAVGNKEVTLSPPAEVDVSVDVVERTSRLRGQRETVDIQLSWKP